jgi:hypothetical protein
MTISLLRRICTVFILGSIAGMIVMPIKNNIGRFDRCSSHHVLDDGQCHSRR